MGLRETITDLLKMKGVMTQSELADTIYGEKGHGANIYAALTRLVTEGLVIRTESNPSYYSLFILFQAVSSYCLQSRLALRKASGMYLMM